MLAVSFPGMDLSGGHHGGMMGMMGGMMVLEAFSGEMMHSMEMDAMNHNVVFSPDGRELWTAMMTDSMSAMNNIECYDRSRTERIASIRVGSDPAEITFTPDGAYAIVCNGGSGTATMIDSRTKEVAATIPVGVNPVGAWPGVDGLMYVDNEDSQDVSIIDPSLKQVVRTVNLGFTPGYVATPSSRSEFWVTDPEAGQVHYLDRDRGERLGAIPAEAGAHAISFNKAGTRA
jgi:YVTN family beta-propeller protein